MEAITDQDRLGSWPQIPFNQWNQQHRQEIVQMAVTEWNYAGPLEVDVDQAYEGYTLGKLANMGLNT